MPQPGHNILGVGQLGHNMHGPGHSMAGQSGHNMAGHNMVGQPGHNTVMHSGHNMAGQPGHNMQGQSGQSPAMAQSAQHTTRHPMGFRRVPPNRHRTIAGDTTSIHEAAKREMASIPSKTPVSVLQELLARRGTVPKYELVQIEGLIHEPIFRYRVTVSDVVAIGTGRSKKLAKHKAAKTLLDKLAGENQPDSTTNGTGSDNADNGDASYEVNPIGWLQEMCMKRFMPPPRYVTEQEEGSGNGAPHERIFTVACVLMSHREVGRGKSKKVAKRQAAHNMWQLLQDTHQDLTRDDELGQKGANAAARYADMKVSKISTLTTSHSHKVAQFHNHLKQNVGPVLAKLQGTPLNTKDFNFVKFLQEIASEQVFEVTYVEIEEKSITNKFQCLVQLSTLPVAVCYGVGKNSKDAQSSAAQNALEYLKIMTKK
ncbi:protein Loquacious-like isoform X1 [Arctopsyche grandis]